MNKLAGSSEKDQAVWSSQEKEKKRRKKKRNEVNLCQEKAFLLRGASLRPISGTETKCSRERSAGQTHYPQGSNNHKLESDEPIIWNYDRNGLFESPFISPANLPFPLESYCWRAAILRAALTLE